MFVAGWMLTKQDGLRKSVLLGAFLSFLGASIRCVPTFLADHTTDRWYVLFCVHFGQVLNALVGPLVQASPSYLSVNWFADGERATATAIGTISNGLGVGFAYLLGPAVSVNNNSCLHRCELAFSCAGSFTHTPLSSFVFACVASVMNGDDVSMFIRGIALMSFIPLALILLFFPDHPDRAPSATYADKAKKRHLGNDVSYCRGFWLAFTNRSFLFLVIAGGLQAGSWFVWSTTLPNILLPLAFSPSQAGSFASVTRFAGIIGGFLAGRLADGTLLHRRLKPMICLFLFLAICGFTMFTLSNPSTILHQHQPLPHTYGFLFISVAIAGFFLGAVSPLFYELSAELTYPSPESTSAAIMTLVNNMVMLILYTTTPQFDVSNINTLMTCTVAISFIILLTLTVSTLTQHSNSSNSTAAAARAPSSARGCVACSDAPIHWSFLGAYFLCRRNTNDKMQE